MPVIIEGYRATRLTLSLYRRARALGLRPHTTLVPQGRTYRIVINGEGREALFGAVYVGARTGRILRAFLTPGNSGRERRIEGARAVCAELAAWQADGRLS